MALLFKIIKTHQIFYLLLTALTVSNFCTKEVLAFKAPFRPKDILPLLPRQISWPILNTLNNAADLLLSFVGAAFVTNDSLLHWKGACFYQNTAWLEFHNKSGSEFGGGTLHVKVKNRGVSIFLMQAGMIGTLQALWEVFPLFTNTGWGENSNLAFLKKHMGALFEERPQPWVTNITSADLRSGDFLVLSKIRGRWGAFETLEKWVTGAYAGHTAICLRDSQGKLWVAESGDNDEGDNVIAILPWEEWWEFELTKDDANPQIALLPLHPELRAKFNESAAWDYAKSMSGKPYGYHNLIFSWIDTVSGNYPAPLDAHLALQMCMNPPIISGVQQSVRPVSSIPVSQPLLLISGVQQSVRPVSSIPVSQPLLLLLRPIAVPGSNVYLSTKFA